MQPSTTNAGPPDAGRRAGLVDRLGAYHFGRRPLLRAVAAGAALSLGSGAASASHGGPHGRVDPYYGYPSPEPQDDLSGVVGPDTTIHEVDLLIEFPLSPEDAHPPFFYFEPTGLHVDPGDAVKFNFATPDHTITAYHPDLGWQQRVPDGVPPFSSPVGSTGGFWLYQFEEAGLYDAFCAPHEILGMVVRLVVGDPEAPAYADDFEAVPPLRAPTSPAELQAILPLDGPWPFLTPTQVLGTEALDQSAITADGSVPWSAIVDELGLDHTH